MKKTFLVLLLIITARAQSVLALPFNDDMVNSPAITGKIMRPPPDGSIANGSLVSHLASRDEAMKLTNPIKGDNISTLNGKRLFQVNCSPCHGDIASDPYVPGTVSKFLPGPNLSAAMYHDKAEGKSDPYIYATIHFGSLSGLMPAVGWKLSPTEHWDVINYIRSVQAKVK
jgi:mono/diheme cytochrome c family protein